MKFTYKVIGIVSAILFLSLAGLSYTLYFDIKKNIAHDVEANISAVTKNIASDINHIFISKMSMAKYVADLVQSDLNKEAIFNVIYQPAIRNNFAMVGFGYEVDGTPVMNKPNWHVAGYDARTRPWYKLSKKHKKIIFTAPYTSPSTGSLLVSIGAPVIQDGNFKGALFYDLKLSFLSKMVKELNLLKGAGKVFIVMANGTIVAHPDKQLNNKKLTDIAPNLSLSNKQKVIEVNNVPHRFGFTKLNATGWYLGYDVNEEKGFAPVFAMAKTMLWENLVALIITAFVLGWILTRLLAPLRKMSADIDAIGNDLSQRLSTEGAPEFALISKGVNQFIQRLQEQIISSKEISSSIESKTQETVSNTQVAAKSMHNQLNELEHLASAMSQMSSAAADIANNAKNAAEITDSAQVAAQQGTKIVTETTDAVDCLANNIDSAVENVQELEQATTNIESILKVINDIADQTNLLALNAAIEAARAGDTGRGFAVVADEVRTLAQRTQSSTTEIDGMLASLQTGMSKMIEVMSESKSTTEKTVNSAHQATQALNEIDAKIKEVADIAMQIASASGQQNSVTQEINKNTQAIRDLSNEVSTIMQETEAQSKSQLEQVLKQEKLINQFKV